MAGLFVVTLIVLVSIVLFFVHRRRGQKLASINEVLQTLDKSKLPEEEVKKIMSNLNKAHLKLMFPRIHNIEFDAGEESDFTFTQFLRDSFVQGFKGVDKDEFIAAFNEIKDQVPPTEDDDTARYSGGDEAIVNQTSRPEAHPTHRSLQGENSIDAAIPCVTTKV